jgi:hypothetical protein
LLCWDSSSEIVLGRRDCSAEDLHEVVHNPSVVWIGPPIIAISEVLIGCLVSAHQVEMEDRQATYKPHTDEAVDDQNH